MTAALDDMLGNTHGAVLFRGSSAWEELTPGTSGDVLTSGGAAADPTWEAPASGVTEVATGAGLTGGPITGTGTVAFATVADLRLLANISGGVAAPSANLLTAIIDACIGTTQGDVLFRNATQWVVLPAGTAGQFLQTAGAAANPAWATVSSPVVSTNDAVSAAGTVQGDATILTSSASNIATCAAGAGCKLQVVGSDPVGSVKYVTNTTANTANLYPDSGSAIDSLGTDITDTIFPGQSKIYLRMGSAQWRIFAQS